MAWKELIPKSELSEKITDKTVEFAKRFGTYLGIDDKNIDDKGKMRKLTTNQLRKFFGEVKRQQMQGFNKTDFIMLKPKLAYAVGRADKGSKIKDLYLVLADAIDNVSDEHSFRNFVTIFEAIVAFHKAAETGLKL